MLIKEEKERGKAKNTSLCKILLQISNDTEQVNARVT